MKTTDELVRELVDREAIRDLPVRYCDCLWRKDVDGLLDLFTGDATFVMKGIEVEAVSHGHAQLKKMHEKALAETTPRLFDPQSNRKSTWRRPRNRPMLRGSAQCGYHHGVAWLRLLRR